MKKSHRRFAFLYSAALLFAAVVLGTRFAIAAPPKPSAQETEALKKELAIIELASNEVKFDTKADPATLHERNGPQVVQMLTPKFDRLTQFSAKSPLAAAMARIDLLDLTALLAFWGKTEAAASIDAERTGMRPTASRGDDHQGAGGNRRSVTACRENSGQVIMYRGLC